jgi:hypothetical protein
MDFRIHDHEAWASETGGTTGGADGCINFEDADNGGLAYCLATGDISLHQAYIKTCETVSLADFSVIASEALMSNVATDPTATKAMFKQNFMWGRTTAMSCDHYHLMPNPENGCSDLTNVFVDAVYAGHPNKVDKPRSTRCALSALPHHTTRRAHTRRIRPRHGHATTARAVLTGPHSCGAPQVCRPHLWHGARRVHHAVRHLRCRSERRF